MWKEIQDYNEHETPAEIDQQVMDIKFDEEFWIKVHQKQSEGSVSWNRALDEVQIENFIQDYKDNGEQEGEDPALLMLKQWPTSGQYKDSSDQLQGLEQKINQLLEILLESELNSDNRYQRFRDKEDKLWKTLLHYAAELGFLHVTKTLVKKCPGLLYLKTRDYGDKRAMLPIELALIAEKDEVAAYLIRVMWHKRVQGLFSWRPDDKMTNPLPSFFSFKCIIENPKMEKTVVAILDQMVNPHWPQLPKRKESYENEEEKEGIEGAWNTITDDPLEYHFYYHILDGDDGGRPPKNTASGLKEQMNNKYFNKRDTSCLHMIAKSYNEGALQHPVVRMLVKTKWKSYGHWFLSLQTGSFVIFLLFMSHSLLHASTKLDPTQYTDVPDILRGFCEIVTLAMAVFYICEEFHQMTIARHFYFTEWITVFDWLGLLLILCMIPLRYAESDVQWLVASLTFLFNFLRIFKFSCVTRTTGLYTHTLAKIILHDVTRSMAVFGVICLSFCGALSLSLCYSDQNQPLSGFGNLLLSGFRALLEQKPMLEDHLKFNWLSVLLMMAYMGIVTLILLNILIAQMSTTYTQAKKVARLEYDVDRILQLSRMEGFPFLNLRVKYYKEGDWISEMELSKELLEFSEDRSPGESVEEKLNAIRNMMRKMVKQMRPGNG
ncbi:uncharacterized protein LOC111346401 [Stylophora pistillata]|uniref:uncharacterized protein LOC111346401 n=1 Tax=Stylophora pistillata TaxID=50429 RepID=UPI000C04CCC6|nr:uncharacterized protein LOC111346401 [Stylophora pistillata]